MSMLLDVFVVTINNMKEPLDSICKDLKIFITEELKATGNSCYQYDKECKECKENGKIDCLRQDGNPYMCPQLRITYLLPFTYLCRKKTFAFDVHWEYFADEKTNRLRFYLSDASDNCWVFDNAIKDNLLEHVPDLWQKGKDEDGIYMELNIDESFTEEKLSQCFIDYKEYILKPFIACLGNKENN